MVSIPSRRVGDVVNISNFRELYHVSIPSRRVGDWNWLNGARMCLLRFHPLKAGRRPSLQPGFEGHSPKVSIPSRRVGDYQMAGDESGKVICFHPLKAGRRPWEVSGTGTGWSGFHPLKAGRRRESPLTQLPCQSVFPSPQGGSETFIFASFKSFATPVSIPSRRVGDSVGR